MGDIVYNAPLFSTASSSQYWWEGKQLNVRPLFCVVSLGSTIYSFYDLHEAIEHLSRQVKYHEYAATAIKLKWSLHGDCEWKNRLQFNLDKTE